jgi:hypothetical protein
VAAEASERELTWLGLYGSENSRQCLIRKATTRENSGSKKIAQQAVGIIKSEGGEAVMDYSVNIRMPDDPPLLTLVSTTKQ